MGSPNPCHPRLRMMKVYIYIDTWGSVFLVQPVSIFLEELFLLDVSTGMFYMLLVVYIDCQGF